MTPSDLQLLKASLDSVVELAFANGAKEVVRVISVFDQESNPDVFYTSLAPDGKAVGDFSAELAYIVSVTAIQKRSSDLVW